MMAQETLPEPVSVVGIFYKQGDGVLRAATQAEGEERARVLLARLEDPRLGPDQGRPLLAELHRLGLKVTAERLWRRLVVRAVAESTTTPKDAATP